MTPSPTDLGPAIELLAKGNADAVAALAIVMRYVARNEGPIELESSAELFASKAASYRHAIEVLKQQPCAHEWKVTSQRLQGMWCKCSKCGATKEETWD